MPRSWWRLAFFGLVIAASLPLLGHWIRGEKPARCAWDGLRLEPPYVVTVTDCMKTTHQFCCVQCARLWLDKSGIEFDRITVTDEASGQEIDAAAAWYVRSTLATSEVTGNRIHVFRTEADAREHVEAARGRLLSAGDAPFSAQQSALEAHDRHK